MKVELYDDGWSIGKVVDYSVNSLGSNECPLNPVSTR